MAKKTAVGIDPRLVKLRGFREVGSLGARTIFPSGPFLSILLYLQNPILIMKAPI